MSRIKIAKKLGVIFITLTFFTQSVNIGYLPLTAQANKDTLRAMSAVTGPSATILKTDLVKPSPAGTAAWSEGFHSRVGVQFAHDKILKDKIAAAFEDGLAVRIVGHQEETLLAAAEERIADVTSLTPKEIKSRLYDAREFLYEVLDDDEFLLRVIKEVSRIVPKEGETDTPFLSRIKAAGGSLAGSLDNVREALLGETRYVAFVFGANGIDPYLYNVGSIYSDEHRVVTEHIGTFAYKGSDQIPGGPRTIYTTLARLLGFAEQGQAGIEAYREVLLHEFMDLARGRHQDAPRDVIKKVQAITKRIDAKYAKVIEDEVRGELIVTKKFTRENDLGDREIFAIQGQSKVHPEVPKGSGKKITVSAIKADIGSIGGHGTVPGAVLEAVADVFAEAAIRGDILSFFITRVGDDISITFTHTHGVENTAMHKLAWDGFINATAVAKDLGLYGAGQDLLADSFSENLRGAGPGVAEMEFIERGAEPILIFQADKTSPGAFNKAIYAWYYDPTSGPWAVLKPQYSSKVKGEVLDFYHDNKKGRLGTFDLAHRNLLHGYIADPNRFSFTNVWVGDEPAVAVAASRLGVTAGEYVGKDDPIMIARSQGAFQPVGSLIKEFLQGPYKVPGWMMGSNWGPFMPAALKESVIGIYDGPPLISSFMFNLNNGRLEGFKDMFADNPAVRRIQDLRTDTALEDMAQQFREPLREAEAEIEYHKGPVVAEEMAKEAGIWKEFEGAPAKASPAGEEGGSQIVVDVDYAKAIRDLSAEGLDIDALQVIEKSFSNIIGEYRRLIAASTDKAWVGEVATPNLRYAQDLAGTIGTTIHAGRVPQIEEGFTLILDKTHLPASQLEIARAIGEIEEIESRLGAKIIFAAPDEVEALKGKGYNPTNAIVIAGRGNVGTFKEIGARTISIDKVAEGQYLPLTSLAIFAKAMLRIGSESQELGILKSIIANAYKSLTGQPLPTKMLERYIANPADYIIMLTLPAPTVVYEEGELRNLHMQAVQALKAA